MQQFEPSSGLGLGNGIYDTRFEELSIFNLLKKRIATSTSLDVCSETLIVATVLM